MIHIVLFKDKDAPSEGVAFERDLTNHQVDHLVKLRDDFGFPAMVAAFGFTELNG